MARCEMEEQSPNSLRGSLMVILYELKSIQNRIEARLIDQWDVAAIPERQRLYFATESPPSRHVVNSPAS